MGFSCLSTLSICCTLALSEWLGEEDWPATKGILFQSREEGAAEGAAEEADTPLYGGECS